MGWRFLSFEVDLAVKFSHDENFYIFARNIQLRILLKSLTLDV